MRVGLRRLRSALALFGRFASPPPGMEDELAWLEEKLGPARDWEVFSHSTLDIVEVPAPEDAGIAHLRHAAIDVASAKRKQAVSAVQSVRFTRLILTLARWLACVSWSSTVEKQWKHKLGGSLPRFAADCIAREQHRVRRCHKHLRNEEPILQHKFRIATKNLRYATEFFQSLYPNKELDDYLGSLAAMQDELGLSNDKMVAEGFLQQLAEEREDLRPSIGFARGFLIAKGNKVDSNLWKHLASMKPKMQK
jgi:CHAD domain-containing protein